MRAPTVCTEPGCPRLVATGRCPEHARPVWHRAAPVPRMSKAWRRAVMRRDQWTCVLCGAPASHADHVIPRAVAPELAADVGNGQALCAACHEHKTRADRVRWGSGDTGAPPLPR